MKLKKIFLIFILALSFLPFCKINAESSNTGFVPGSIWYSKDPLTEGDKVKIYTLIFNPENKELSGTVMFFDKETLLGKKDIKVSSRATKDVSVDWTVTAGKHSIYAKIENAKFLVSAGKYENALLSKIETEKDIFTISKKIQTESTDGKSKTSSNSDSDVDSVKNFITEKTPSFIAKPIISTTDFLENFRQNTSEKTEVKRDEAKQELEDIKKIETESETGEKQTSQKIFKYIEVAVLQIVLFIFSNQFVFYTVLFILVFLVLRYIWLKIF